MKILIAVLLTAVPAAAQAMGMHGGMRGGMHGCCSGAGVHMAVALYALMAVIGYWVLQHSSKETANYVKKTGQVLGWSIIVIGLLGIICGLGSHARKNCRCSGGEMMISGERTGNGPMMHPDCPMKGEMMKGGMMKKEETAPPKK